MVGREGRQIDPQDSVLAELWRAPYTISRPRQQTSPFVFASTHSGKLYPARFVAESRLTPLALRRSEDAFVDELFAAVAPLGAPLIAARFPRAFVDPNRAARELDRTMFDDALAMEVDAGSARVAAGLGVIPRIVRDGAEIYRGKLAPADAEERLNRLYRPYHRALAELVEETRTRFGVAVVVDCHSMPSAANVPDIVLGDRYGASASPGLMRFAERAFQACGFSVARNAPYAGGHTTDLYGRRDKDIHALQIEVNRALYLDEERIERGAHFEAVREKLAGALAHLTALGANALHAAPPPLAAE